jgi:hypothetical protein
VFSSLVLPSSPVSVTFISATYLPITFTESLTLLRPFTEESDNNVLSFISIFFLIHFSQLQHFHEQCITQLTLVDRELYTLMNCLYLENPVPIVINTIILPSFIRFGSVSWYIFHSSVTWGVSFSFTT